jgi:hypothetical protein
MKKSMSSVLALSAVLAFASSAQAQENLQLDTRGAPGAQAAGPVTTASTLAANEQYVVKVTGTISIWPESQWRMVGTTCGAAEVAPLIPSPGASNGPVGWDAETVFAVPPGVSFNGYGCDPSAIPFHSLKQSPGGLQMNFGSGFSHVEPYGGARSTPRADHTYAYQVTGQGQPASFRFLDDPVKDNYGVFGITVLTAAECAAQNCLTNAGTNGDTAGQSRSSTAIVLPSAHSCASRRRFRVHFRVNKGIRIATASARVNTRFYKVIKKQQTLQSFVDLRGLPKGAFTLRIRATTTRHQVLTNTRRYHTCIPKIRKHKHS